jgi:hypothetical protein
MNINDISLLQRPITVRQVRRTRQTRQTRQEVVIVEVVKKKESVLSIWLN